MARRLNFRTVKVIPCERKTLTHEISTCREYSFGGVSKQPIALCRIINSTTGKYCSIAHLNART